MVTHSSIFDPISILSITGANNMELDKRSKHTELVELGSTKANPSLKIVFQDKEK